MAQKILHILQPNKKQKTTHISKVQNFEHMLTDKHIREIKLQPNDFNTVLIGNIPMVIDREADRMRGLDTKIFAQRLTKECTAVLNEMEIGQTNPMRMMNQLYETKTTFRCQPMHPTIGLRKHLEAAVASEGQSLLAYHKKSYTPVAKVADKTNTTRCGGQKAEKICKFDHGFVACISGVITVMNESASTLHPGTLLTWEESDKYPTQHGIHARKARFRYKKAGPDDEIVGKVLSYSKKGSTVDILLHPVKSRQL